MLLIYRKSTGEVVSNQGKLDGSPLGLDDTSILVNYVVSQFGGNKDDYGLFRLHDIEDAETVNKTFTHEYTIQDGQVVFGAEIILPEPEPRPPSELELLKQENMTLQIALAETIEKQETDKINNQIALAELVETLIIQGVL